MAIQRIKESMKEEVKKFEYDNHVPPAEYFWHMRSDMVIWVCAVVHELCKIFCIYYVVVFDIGKELIALHWTRFKDN